MDTESTSSALDDRKASPIPKGNDGQTIRRYKVSDNRVFFCERYRNN